MKAMVLAAGEGTRLRPLTLTLPKPLVPVAGTPLLSRTLALLAGQGVDEVVVNLFHRPEALTAALGGSSNLGVRTITWSHEETLLGTAGGVKKAEAAFGDTFLVLYGDNLYDINLAPLVAFHRARGALATLATFDAPNPSACGLVATDADGRVTRFQEKPPPSEVFTRQANAGVYVLEPEVLKHIPAGTACDFGRDVFPDLLARFPGQLFATPLGGYLQDTGTVPAYRQSNWDVLEGRAGGGTPTARFIGLGTQIAPSASLTGRNVIGANGHVEGRAHLHECIVWDDCRIGEGAHITGAILGRGVTIGDRAIICDGAILADGAIVAPGAQVAENARIAPGAQVH